MRDRGAAVHARNPRRASATQRCPSTPREETGIRHADARPANDIGDDDASGAEWQPGAGARYRVGGCGADGGRYAIPRENHGGATARSDTTRISVRVAVTGDRCSEARRAQCPKFVSPSTRAGRFSRSTTTSQHQQLAKHGRIGCPDRANAMGAGDFRGQPRGTKHSKRIGICRGLEKTRVTQGLIAARTPVVRSSARRACRRAVGPS